MPLIVRLNAIAIDTDIVCCRTARSSALMSAMNLKRCAQAANRLPSRLSHLEFCLLRTAQQTAISKVARENECEIANVSVTEQVQAPSPAGATYRLAACGAQFMCDVSPTAGANCRALSAEEATEPAAPPTPAPEPATPPPASTPPPPPPTMPVDAPTPALPPPPPPDVSLTDDEINAVIRELGGTILQDCPTATEPAFATFQILINSVGTAEFVSAEPALAAETEACVRRLVGALQFRATTDDPRTITTEQIRIVPEEYPQPE